MIHPFLFTLSLLASPSILIQDATIEIGNGKVLHHASLLSENGKIVSLGHVQKVPKNTLKINASGKILTPGLFATKTQLGLVEVRMESSTDDRRLRGQNIAPAFRAQDGLNPHTAHIAIARHEGITTVFTAPSGGIIAGKGVIWDLDSNRYQTQSLHDAAMIASVSEYAREVASTTRGGIWIELRRLFHEARKYRKNADAYENGLRTGLYYSTLDLQAMQPVLKREIPLVIEAYRASDIQNAIHFANKEHIRIVIAGGTEAWMVAKELAQNDISVILEQSAQAPQSFEMLHARDDLAALLYKQGVRIILSAGDEFDNIRRLRQEAGIAVAYGLPRDVALSAITWNPARTFENIPTRGLLQIGKRANFVLWSGDPLELSSHAELVVINGEVQSNETRQTLLAKRYLATR